MDWIKSFAAFSVMTLCLACTTENRTDEKPEEEGGGSHIEYQITMERSFYAEGADISWSTQMEEEGIKFHNADGEERECTQLMKELGMNSIRLRVWVNPSDGWCGREDVIAKAEKAHALGMKIMIDFHYSDSWADPSKQVTPSAWTSYDMTGLSDALGQHTKDVLGALKAKNIDIEWVQVGNEVNNGMLHPYGKIQNDSASGFVRLFNTGYEAVKDIYPEATVILHVSNGHDQGLFSWFFDMMKANGAKYDMIGMSLYPSWWENGGWINWLPAVNSCIANIKNVIKVYERPVMICETGMPVEEPQMSKEALQYIIDKTMEIKECHGVFYWEPQAHKGYNGGYDKGAFADGKPTIALDPFKD